MVILCFTIYFIIKYETGCEESIIVRNLIHCLIKICQIIIRFSHCALNSRNNVLYIRCPLYMPWRLTEDVNARLHIYTATPLGRGRVASSTLGRFYFRGKPPLLILYEAEWTPGPFGHEGIQPGSSRLYPSALPLELPRP